MQYKLRDDEFWKDIPAWKDVSREEFGNHLWQQKHAVTSLKGVKNVLQDRVPESFFLDVEEGLKITPMNIRITPYVFALIDWDNPEEDPLRKQFLPLGSQFLPDHPYYKDDSLNEDVDSPVPMITHRYPDKVLFLPLTVCPVYCSYCTRSRLVGGSTDTKEKSTYGASSKKWEAAFEYLANHPEVEDVVISGGDAYMLRPKQIEEIGFRLLQIPHIRKIRYATKGIAIFPMKVTSDEEWLNAVKKVHDHGRSLRKEVCIHTHFSCRKEITQWTYDAMGKLYEMGITVRNQAVFQRGVNNDADHQIDLVKTLAYCNIQPYYVYQHDMVPGCEHFRSSLRETIEVAKRVKGSTAGFNTPTFICDLPGGGGKREISSYEEYNEFLGISAWKAPTVKPGEVFFYFDPIDTLSKEGQDVWKNNPEKIEEFLKESKEKYK